MVVNSMTIGSISPRLQEAVSHTLDKAFFRKTGSILLEPTMWWFDWCLGFG